MQNFFNDPNAVARFEQQHGKIGALSLQASLFQASQFLGRPYEELKQLVESDGLQNPVLSLGGNLLLKEGAFLMIASDSVTKDPKLFGTVKFENTSGQRQVLMLESFDEMGSSQGFVYKELQPGATFSFKHNDPTRAITGNIAIGVPRAGATTIVYGTADGFNLSAAALESAFNPERACALVKAKVLKNKCIGNCRSGNCHATETGSFWVFGTEPEACGC